jgi:phosphoesterase RecJ-like protein
MNEALLSAADQELKAARNVLICAHIRPDGDAIGSLLGLGLTMQAAGKRVEMVLVDGLPTSYKFLSGTEQIVNRPSGVFDLIVTVDCSDTSRIGSALDGYRAPDINIDHHITNEYFAKINLVDDTYVATSEILADFLPQAGFALTQPAAAALLTGIVTDTLGFRTANMTARAFRVAANLLEFEIDLPEIFDKTLIQRTFEAVEYWASGLARLRKDDGIVWTSLTIQDRKEAKYPGRDDADLINILSGISEIDIAIVFVEQNPHRIKVSWRARSGLDVSQVALGFGGGGHPAAAGADIRGTLPEVQEQVLAATIALLREHSYAS